MYRSPKSFDHAVRGAAFITGLVACLSSSWAAAADHALHAYPLAARVSAQVVQNTTGNAYALQVGLAPRLRIDHFPVGLKLLLEYGALRDTQHHIFSAPSAQALLDWAIAPRLQIALGAGAQFWFAPTGSVTLPVVTLEAHYVPPRKLFGARSAFVASSIGASHGAGLQVRAGIEFDLHGEPAAAASIAAKSDSAVTQSFSCPPVIACPPCLKAPPAAEAKPPVIVEVVKSDAALGERMTFAFNVTSLDAQARAYVARLAQALMAASSNYRALAITGHASARGTEAQNLEVSVRRAQSVARALVAHGVPEHKLTIHGVGESAPLPGFDPNDAAQQCVVLQLLGAEGQGPLQDLITLPKPHQEPRP